LSLCPSFGQKNLEEFFTNQSFCEEGGSNMEQPETQSEWQIVVDLASFYLHLDSAKKYALVTGGPEINLQRCEELLETGKAQGIIPSPDHIERLTGVFQSQ
jgi:hypothetical protein